MKKAILATPKQAQFIWKFNTRNGAIPIDIGEFETLQRNVADTLVFSIQAYQDTKKPATLLDNVLYIANRFDFEVLYDLYQSIGISEKI